MTVRVMVFFALVKQDTVVDAGIFDGSLGIISALAALKVLNVNGKLGTLKRPIEVSDSRSFVDRLK